MQQAVQGIDLKRLVADAVEAAEIPNFEAWADLDALSTRTVIEHVEVDDAGIIFEDDGKFRGTVNFYVLLQYGNDPEDGFVDSDSYSGAFEGRIEGGVVLIERIQADTSSFYL